MGDYDAGKRILLLTQPRTSSHLLERMLSKQPEAIYFDDPFLSSHVHRRELLEDGPLENGQPAPKLDLLNQLKEGYQQLRSGLVEAHDLGKIALVRLQPSFMLSPAVSSEFVYGQPCSNLEKDFWTVERNVESPPSSSQNPTIVPDAVFFHPGTKIVFTMRHPILVVESLLRGWLSISGREIPRSSQKTGSTLHWQRMLYDWLNEARSSRGPDIVIADAEDFAGPDKERFMTKLCCRIGLDSNSVIYTWNKMSDQEFSAMPNFEQVAFRTILCSEGIVAGKGLGDRTLDTAFTSWVSEFGEEEAGRLKGFVENAMPDYEYLRARRLRV